MEASLSDDSSEEASTHTFGPSPVSHDVLFHTLQNERRRLVIRYLQDCDGPVDLPSLVDQVTAWELQTRVDDLSAEARQRIYIDLYQSQLPKLDEQGFVSYSKSRGLVRPMPLLEAVGGYLSSSDLSARDSAVESSSAGEPATRRFWLGYYAMASLLSAALLGLAAFGPFGAVSVSFQAAAAVVAVLHVALTTGLFVDHAS